MAFEWLAALCGVAFAAGILDSIGGGGGVLTLPTLLWAGVGPHAALATNKAQSVFGTWMALWRYRRAGYVQGALWRPMLAGGLAAASGAWAVAQVGVGVLRPLVVMALLSVALLMLWQSWPRLHDPGADAVSPTAGPASLAAGTAITWWLPWLAGLYDGAFGPGTGTFLILAYVRSGVTEPVEASARAKVINAATNLGALLWFGASGAVLWSVAFPMAVCQMAGAALGVHVAVRRGAVWVRRGVLVALSLLLARALALALT